jgi:hypothetical protein
MLNKRINIFTGHFGSGKTEVAVNFAFKLKESYDRVAIVDFDVVNPYFRTADARKELEEKGIWAIVPLYANTNVDVPALPPEINALFEKKEYSIVFDVGGDDIGARVLSRYNEQIIADDYEMFFVVNTRRPMTDTSDKIEGIVREIEQSSRLKVTKLINNTNILGETTSDQLLEGHRTIERAAKNIGVEMAFASGFRNVLQGLPEKSGLELFEMEKYIKLPWERG